jgi:hypothetical protein
LLFRVGVVNVGPLNNKLPFVAASYQLKVTPEGALGLKVAVSFIHIFSPFTVGRFGFEIIETVTEVLPRLLQSFEVTLST